MNKDISYYIHRHTLLITTAVVAVFFVLAAGEFYIYRKVMEVNHMVSEGFMQLKEAGKVTDQVMMKGGKMMLKKNGDFVPMESNLSMPSGLKVMMNGTVIKPDNTRMKIQENQTMVVE